MKNSLKKAPAFNPTFQIEEQDQSARHSVLTIKPLENGYGHTVGNALRRVLLSSLPGAAITTVSIEGADHQFASIDGVKEDVIELLLNLKQVRIKADSNEEGKLKLSADKKGQVTAGDFEAEAGFEVINPDQHIATLEEGAKLEMEMKVETGLGYKVGQEMEEKFIGEISVDALFSPVVKVSYTVESTRVGRRTDFDKLILDVTTDGTISPRRAVEQAARILHKQFEQVFNPVEVEEKEEEPELSPEEAEVLRLTVEELDLPTRIANALRRGGYKNVGDLVEATRENISKVKNIGEKSIDVVQEALEQKDVSLKD
ncbi:MAG: DNA-directed RNA polymerase subunit alpha [Candidatus Pacebacteria bacterium]|nr:DNA-directed RNA polymerase subunit alpha [Candidatus Paceibacterota bacterium]